MFIFVVVIQFRLEFGLEFLFLRVFDMVLGMFGFNKEIGRPQIRDLC